MGELGSIRQLIPHADAPASIEAEQMLLGAVLTDNEVFHRVADILTAEHFFDPVHQRIWTLCAEKIGAGQLASPVTLKHLMQADTGLGELGGPAYLARLAGVAMVSAARDYALILIDCHHRRALLKALDEARAGVTGSRPLSEVAGVIEAATGKLLAGGTRAPSASFAKAATGMIDQMAAAYQGESVGLLTGISELDDMLGGMFPADLVILAGGPSMGKSALAMSITKAIAEQGHGVAVASLEMTEEALAQRIISAETKIPYFRLRSGDLSAGEMERAVRAALKLESLPVQILGPDSRDLAKISAVTKRIQDQMQGNLKLVVVDYLQLVKAPGKDRFQIVGEVSMGLKALAKNLGVPVIALSQISRDVASRDDKRPRLQDLRESAQIEQDADMVLFTHREHYYLDREGPPRGKDGKVKTEALVDFEASKATAKFQMDLILAKHRSGAIGDRKIGCDVTVNRFWSLQDTQEAMEFAG